MKETFSGNRRTFIKSAALFGGLAALFGTTRPKTSRIDDSPEPAEPQSRGYRLTEHIKKYYESAKF